MADRAYDNAVEKREAASKEIEALTQRIDALRREIRDADSFIAMWHQFAGTAGKELKPANVHAEQILPPAVTQASATRRTRIPGNPKKEEVTRVTRQIIEERGEPVGRTDLYNELAARGLRVQGADPEMVLSTMLWRTREKSGLIRLPSGGYWIADRDVSVHGQPSGLLEGERSSERPSNVSVEVSGGSQDNPARPMMTSLDRFMETPALEPRLEPPTRDSDLSE